VGVVNLIKWQLINPFIEKVANLLNIHIEIIDLKGVIVASSDLTRINLYRLEVVDFDEDKEEITSDEGIYLPLMSDKKIASWVYLKGKVKEEEKVLLKAALEENLEIDKLYKKLKLTDKEEENLLSFILDKNSSIREDDLKLWALNLGYDLELPRTMIVIKFIPKENRYFNINLHLGYDFAQENLKGEIKRRLRDDIYITKQDIISFYSSNLLVICKSFLETSNLPRIYQALDVICNNIYKNIYGHQIFNFQISYGGVGTGLSSLRQSFFEALEILELGSSYGKNYGFINDDDILFEFLANALPERLIARHIEPMIQKLLSLGDGANQLLQTLETYIENKMNIKLTSERLYIHRNTVANHLEKIKQLTGIDPNGSFKNIFWLKMLVVYCKLKNNPRSGDDNETQKTNVGSN